MTYLDRTVYKRLTVKLIFKFITNISSLIMAMVIMYVIVGYMIYSRHELSLSIIFIVILTTFFFSLKYSFLAEML